MDNKRLLCGLALAWTLATTQAGAAETLPLWEAGAGVGVINFPNYRGSSERQTYVLPVPYLVYRGDFLKIDRQQARGVFFKGDRTELDISLNGSVPVRSKDNTVRQGMPDLNPTIEIGPSLKVTLTESKDEKTELNLRLPVRPVFATDLSTFRNVGWIFQPQLNANLKDAVGNGWNLGLVTGPLFADKSYHQFFYGVDAAYATPSRPVYAASSGYSGFQFIGSISKRFPKYWAGGYMKYDDLHGATFLNSPLVTRKNAFTAGFAITWIFAESQTKVVRNE